MMVFQKGEPWISNLYVLKFTCKTVPFSASTLVDAFELQGIKAYKDI